MIDTQDRAGWFGASDTSYIMGNWTTKTWQTWWLKKLGLDTSHFTTRAMNAGTYYEHAILDAAGAPRKDHQILIPELHLRINLDGDRPADDLPGHIWECKTHKEGKVFKPTKAYWQQVQVQIFGKSLEEGKLPTAEIIAYPLGEAEYKNFFLDIDPEKITHHPIEYDSTFIKAYTERLAILGPALEAGTFPKI